MVERHPHIYGDVKVVDAEEVKKNWEQIKLKEGRESVLEGVPKSLPALVKSTRIQEKVAGVGFEWERIEEVWKKVEEELQELKVEIKLGNKDRIESEFGDVLFALTNYARFLAISPENALERTNKRFINRFQHMEKQLKKEGKNMPDLPLEILEKYWVEAKKFY